MYEEKITIIIVTYNAYPFVKSCLESVFAYTNPKHQIVVVDNYSNKKTRDFLIDLERKEKINLILNSSNKLWSPANNQGLKISDEDSQFCLLLNSDVEILKDNWILELQKPMKYKSIGITGTQHNFVPIQPTYCAVDGCCFMFRKSLLNKIGFLDEKFPWNGAGFVFTVAAWEKGSYYFHVNDSSLIIHYGKQSRIENKIQLNNTKVNVNSVIQNYNLIPKYDFYAYLKYRFGLFDINKYISSIRENNNPSQQP